ncbi:MAG: sigma-70 family RNA polymerase sigma factor [Clostridia bacterium]|nr:sigma-70 family RNA polymerase sigma factor [Clostridia bacterium]
MKQIINDQNIEMQFNKMWQDYEPYIRKLCEYKLRSIPHCIDDCVQETFNALVKSMKSGIVIEHPKAWLSTVANNKIKDIYEQRKKEAEYIVFQNEEIDRLAYYDDIKIKNMTDDEIEKLRFHVLSQLTDFEQILIDDYYVKKMKIKEIAEKNLISQSSVKQKLFRTRKMIVYLAKKEIDEHNL